MNVVAKKTVAHGVAASSEDGAQRNTSAGRTHRLAELLLELFEPRAAAVGSPLVALDEVVREREAARKLRDSGELACVKIGRRWYAKRSDVEAMFDRLAAATPRRPKPARVQASDPAAALAAIAGAERKRGAR